MSSTWFRPSHIAAATLLIGGGLLVVLPHHAPSLIRLVAVSLAAAMALHALTWSSPPRWWRSPFVRARRGRPTARAADELDWLHALLAGPRQRLPGAAPLPPEIISALRPLLHAAVQRHGDTAPLSPQSRAVLDAAAHRQPPWYRLLPPDADAAARAVHVVLDDIEGLATSRHSAESYTVTTTGTA
jgi:hypothetical protein